MLTGPLLAFGDEDNEYGILAKFARFRMDETLFRVCLYICLFLFAVGLAVCSL